MNSNSSLGIFFVLPFVMAFTARDADAQFTSFERHQLTLSGGDGTEGFGAAIGVQGSRIFIGVPGSDTVATDAGEVQWFGAGSPPTFQGTIHGSGLAASDGFGVQLAVDGDRLAIAAANHAPAGVRSGAVYIFAWSGTTWIQEAKLWAADGAAGDNFGAALALSGDTLLVGAPDKDELGIADEGAAYVFSRSSGTWSFVQKLGTPDHGLNEGFGHSVAVDGDHLAIGSDFGNGGYPTGTGSVFPFQRSGGTWIPNGRLIAPSFAGVNGTFGAGLDLEGDVLVVGQPYGSAPSGNIGVVHVYRSVLGSWTSEASLESPDTYTQSPLVGQGLALVGDRIVAGATWLVPYGFASGGVVVFRRVGGSWAGAKVDHMMIPSSGTSLTFFGQALASDGVRVLARDSGAFAHPIVWVFDNVDAVGAEYCFGDDSGTPCPCANPSPSAGRMGCANESAGRGATLRLAGSTSIAANDLEAGCLGTGDQAALILFVGTAQVAGGAGFAFGDGLLCAGGSLLRFPLKFAATWYGLAVYGSGLNAWGLWSSGDTRYLQAHYRSSSGPCGSSFNLTNAVGVTFTP